LLGVPVLQNCAPEVSVMAGEKSGAVWVGVVGAVAGAVTAAALGWLASAWLWLVGFVGAVWVHLSAQSSMPNWLAYLLSLISATWALSAWLRYRRNSKDNHERFNQFIWDGVRWRWRFISGQPTLLSSYCPACDTQLVYEQTGGDLLSGDPLITELHCEHCGTRLLREEGSYKNVTARVARQVDRLIRTDKWRDYVDTPGA